MKRLLLFAFLLISSFTGIAQGDKLPWQENTKLTWNHFTGNADLSSEFFARTEYSFQYSSGTDANKLLTIHVKCSFDKSKSWKKPEKKLTPELLAHEQGHFDLAELFARKMRKAFAEYAATHKDGPTTSADLAAIFKRYMNECYALQNTYDKETDHSKNTAKQEEWNKKIPTLLAQLSQYKI